MSARISDLALTGSPLIDTTRSPTRSSPQRIAGVSLPMALTTTSSPSKPSPRPRLSFGVRESVTITVGAALLVDPAVDGAAGVPRVIGVVAPLRNAGDFERMAEGVAGAACSAGDGTVGVLAANAAATAARCSSRICFTRICLSSASVGPLTICRALSAGTFACPTEVARSVFTPPISTERRAASRSRRETTSRTLAASCSSSIEASGAGAGAGAGGRTRTNGVAGARDGSVSGGCTLLSAGGGARMSASAVLWFAASASVSAVSPFLFLAPGSAPCSSSSCTIGAKPCCAAVMSARHPCSISSSGSAPCSRSSLATSTWPRVAAAKRHVHWRTPRWLTAPSGTERMTLATSAASPWSALNHRSEASCVISRGSRGRRGTAFIDARCCGAVWMVAVAPVRARA